MHLGELKADHVGAVAPAAVPPLDVEVELHPRIPFQPVQFVGHAGRMVLHQKVQASPFLDAAEVGVVRIPAPREELVRKLSGSRFGFGADAL